MNLNTDNFILDSCEYTPVYLIENPNVTQVQPYVLTQNNDEQKPVSDLRRFYENSGNLDSVANQNAESSTKPRILKKYHTNLVGNNLKLASFLIPKNDNNKNINIISKNGTTKHATLINRSDTGGKHVAMINVSEAANGQVPTTSVSEKSPVAVININDIATQHLATLNRNETLNNQQLAMININEVSNQHYTTINRNDSTNRQQISVINIGDAKQHVLVNRNETLNQHLIAINRNDMQNKEVALINLADNNKQVNDMSKPITMININDGSNISTVNLNESGKQMAMINVNDSNHIPAMRNESSKLTMINLNETLNKSNLVAISKNDTNKHVVLNNVVTFQQSVPKTNSPTVSSVPIINMDRKIVKVDKIPPIKKATRTIPKSNQKAKEIKPNTTGIPSRHTSVQLLKLGETYHSLNQLSADQMKMVNHALKMFSDPEKTMEPTYDPVTNTRYIYKVVSPRDLTVVGRNKILIKDKKDEPKKDNTKKVRLEERRDMVQLEPETKKIMKKELKADSEPKKVIKKDLKLDIEETPIIKVLQNQVTRSGRQVKLPKKQLEPEESSPKPKKKNGNIVSCFQCSTEFPSLYRLQRHYEIHPTHIPARIHYSLFHCLLAIIKSGSEEDSTNIFIQQLEELIAKLKTLLPCLLKKIDGKDGKMCTINDDVGRLFGMSPGNYNLNIDALNCVKDKDGHCRHNPPKNTQFSSDVKPSQVWLCKHNEEIANNENETEDCARINSVDKWPRVSKRIWTYKQKKSQKLNAKKMRLASESDTFIELGVDDVVTDNAINITPPEAQNNEITDIPIDDIISDEEINLTAVEEQNKPKIPQFHSAHFDIRSSPIKPSSAIFSKFQINPEKIAKYDAQIIRPLDLDGKETQEIQREEDPTSSLSLPSLLDIDIGKDNNDINRDLSFDPKEWSINTSNEEQSNSLLTGSLIESALLQVTEGKPENGDNLTSDTQGQSVLNFLDSLGNDCLAYPETEIRNNSVDFHLDLFSFNNS